MPVYDYQCRLCDLIKEVIAPVSKCNRSVSCPECGGKMYHIITASGVYLGNDDAPWLKSVLEVVDKENPSRHAREFIKNPSRKNYKAWLKGEGLRPLESGERAKPKTPDMTKHAEKLFRLHQKRKRLEIG